MMLAMNLVYAGEMGDPQASFNFLQRPLHRFRCYLHGLFGVQINEEAHITPVVRNAKPLLRGIANHVAVYSRIVLCAFRQISIGARVTICHGAYLREGSNNYRNPAVPFVKSPVSFGSDAQVCIDAFSGPDCTFEEQANMGARAVAVSHVALNAIVAVYPVKQGKGRVNYICACVKNCSESYRVHLFAKNKLVVSSFANAGCRQLSGLTGAHLFFPRLTF